LDSGYETQFVQTVPAVKQINTLGVFAQNSAPTVFPGQGSTLQYGTFNWLSPAPNPTVNLACAGLTQIFQFPNGGYIGWYPNTPPRTWYYVPPPGETVDAARIAVIKQTLRWEAAKACRGSINDPTVCAFDENVSFQSACYFAGATSPFIYFYTKTAKQVNVQLAKNVITYTDPALSKEGVWKFIVSPDNKLTFSNGLTRQNLYYEYDKNIFKSVTESLRNDGRGFLIEKNQLAEFVNSISNKAGLNLAERESLFIEMSRELNRLTGNFLKVGIVDRKILDKVLPVSITPQPEAYHRFFLYVTSAVPHEKLTQPTVEKLTRVDDMVVELGVLGL